MSTSWLLHIHVTCQTSLLGRSTLAPTPQLATLLCEVITLILSTGGQLASLEMHQNLDCIKYHPVIWESKKLGNARRFTHSGELSELKPPKPLWNDPGFTLLRRIPSRFQKSDAPLSLPGTLLSLLSNLSRHQKFGAPVDPVDFLWSFCSNWLGAYPPRIIILWLKYCEITSQKTVDRSR